MAKKYPLAWAKSIVPHSFGEINWSHDKRNAPICGNPMLPKNDPNGLISSSLSKSTAMVHADVESIMIRHPGRNTLTKDADDCLIIYVSVSFFLICFFFIFFLGYVCIA